MTGMICSQCASRVTLPLESDKVTGQQRFPMNLGERPRSKYAEADQLKAKAWRIERVKVQRAWTFMTAVQPVEPS